MKFKNFVRYFIMFLWNGFFCYVPSFTFRYIVLKYFYRANLGKCTIHRCVKFFSPWKLTVGDNVNIQFGSFIDCRGSVFIEDNVDITLGVKILSQYHDINSSDYSTVSKKVRIERYAILGSYSLILPGVVVKEGTVVGAGSVVAKTTETYSLYCGNPAVFKSKRNRLLAYTPYYKRPFH